MEKEKILVATSTKISKKKPIEKKMASEPIPMKKNNKPKKYVSEPMPLLQKSKSVRDIPDEILEKVKRIKRVDKVNKIIKLINNFELEMDNRKINRAYNSKFSKSIPMDTDKTLLDKIYMKPKTRRRFTITDVAGPEVGSYLHSNPGLGSSSKQQVITISSNSANNNRRIFIISDVGSTSSIANPINYSISNDESYPRRTKK